MVCLHDNGKAVRRWSIRPSKPSFLAQVILTIQPSTTPAAGGRRIGSVRNVGVGLLLLGLAVGCDAAKYQLAPVSGVVMLDGEPLAGAVVNFQPKRGSERVPAPGSVGRTDAAGKYQLATIQDEPGAAVGRHRVKIYSYSPESPLTGDSGEQGKELVPERYNYRSRLTFDVPADGSEDANFELKTGSSDD